MSYPVGLQTLAYVDHTRRSWQSSAPRPLLSQIWYPAAAGSAEAPVLIGPPDAAIFSAGSAAPGAAPADAPHCFPLILLSHGTGGATLQLGWLASALAAQGYLVAGVNHHGNTAIEPYVAAGFARWWERARDLSAMLDQLLASPVFGPRILRDRIGAAGFSLGGTTAIALAGGRFDLHALHAAYRDTGRDLRTLVPPEFPDPQGLVGLLEGLLAETDWQRSYRDPRVRAVFAMAPALGEAFLPSGLQLIDIPIAIVAGAADTNTPPAANALHYTSHIPNADLTLLDGQVGHYTFLAQPTPLGREILPELCVDHPQVDRAAIHERVSALAAAFFNAHLLSQPG